MHCSRTLLLPLLLSLVSSLAWALAAAAGVHTWVDEDGVVHITDDPEGIPPSALGTVGEGRAALRGLWDSVIDPEPLRGAMQSSSSQADRSQRLIQAAMDDLERGETARASAALMGILRDEPARPEAHWLLALLDRQRGRYESSEVHLRAFLAAAGDEFEALRDSARRRLDALADEQRLADPSPDRPPTRWLGLSSAHFRVRYDADLGDASPEFAKTVLRYLEEARHSVGQRLGAVPAEAMGVVFYGKAAYLRAHRHRFSFQTVGFFDGRIHVVSAAHPAGELRALLFHEYAHAVFREQTGGDRPYWLNEGMAELAERDSRRRSGLARGERVALRMRLDAARWIPLRRLAPSFSGLDDEDARAAYLQSLAAADWIDAHTDRAGRARMLSLLGEGMRDDETLIEVLGLDTAGLEAAVQAEIRSQFPARRTDRSS